MQSQGLAKKPYFNVKNNLPRTFVIQRLGL